MKNVDEVLECAIDKLKKKYEFFDPAFPAFFDSKISEILSLRCYELTNEQWDKVKDMIVHAKRGRPPKDDRLMLNAMLWLARNGAGWEDLPERYGPWKTVYSRFCKWRDDGTFLRIFEALRKYEDKHMKNLSFMKNLSLDSTVLKVHPHSAGAKKGL